MREHFTEYGGANTMKTITIDPIIIATLQNHINNCLQKIYFAHEIVKIKVEGSDKYRGLVSLDIIKTSANDIHKILEKLSSEKEFKVKECTDGVEMIDLD